MAILKAQMLAKLRQNCAREISVTYDKALINAVLQAVEDWFTSASVVSSLNTAINDAGGSVLTAAQKRAMVKFWLLNRFERGN